MNTGTRIFELITAERHRQVDRYSRTKQQLDRLLQEYDLRQSAVLLHSSSSGTAARLIPRFVAEAELVDLTSSELDRMKSIDRMVDTLAKRGVEDARNNGDDLIYAANLILDEGRHCFELQYEIQAAIHEYADAVFQIQVLDRLILGLANTEVDENASVRDLIETLRSVLAQTPVG